MTPSQSDVVLQVDEMEKSTDDGCTSRHVAGVSLLLLLVIASCACLVSQQMRDTRLEKQLVPCSQKINNQILTLEMKKLGDFYYYFSEIKHEWWKAERECSSRGLHLLTIDSRQQNEVVKAYIRALKVDDPVKLTSFWTSATSLAGGELLWFRPERPLEFSDLLNEDVEVQRGRCMHIERSGPSVYWRVNNCQERFRYVCQLKLDCLLE